MRRDRELVSYPILLLGSVEDSLQRSIIYRLDLVEQLITVNQ
jgi:hypothetical protein